MSSLGGVTAKLAILAAVLAAATVAATLDSASSPRAPARVSARFFSASGVWNEPPAAGAALDPSSHALVGALDAEVADERAAGRGPWINTSSYSVPIYTVPATQPTVAVSLDHAPEPPLSAAWSAVPLPLDARPASGTDGDLVVWQPSTDRMWEFWRLVNDGAHWSATWGGAMQHVSANPGVYGTEAWPGAEPWWGVSASSLAIAGGLITFEDLRRGRIDHALVISVPNVRAGVFAAPARRTDGTSTSPLSLPEGAHLRLDPRLNLHALHLPHMTLMLAEAAQRYGIFVGDFSPNVAFYAQDPTPTGADPYAGPHGYFAGLNPSQLLAAFPWAHLQLLRMALHVAP